MEANSFKHGGCVGGKNSAEYSIYSNAKRRCINPNRDRYKDYGGRGIEFRFTSFQEFIDHVGPRPSVEHTLERIDNDGHYAVGNVEWALQDKQRRNQRRNRHITYKGETRVQEDWLKDFPRARNRLYRGDCVPCAFENPPSRARSGTIYSADCWPFTLKLWRPLVFSRLEVLKQPSRLASTSVKG